MRPREPARELDLIVREHVDRVALGALEGGEARAHAGAGSRAIERRVERDRVERVGGEADVAAVGAPRAQITVTPVANCASASRNCALGERGGVAGAVGGHGGRIAPIGAARSMVAAPDGKAMRRGRSRRMPRSRLLN